MKSVEYHGQLFSVPDWAEYICMDSDGEVYFYEERPSLLERGLWDYNKRCQFIGVLEQYPQRWEKC